MSTPYGRRSNLLLATLLLAMSILLEQYFIAPIFPQLGSLGGIRPMIVFLDIPLELPTIDVLPVSLLFALFYQIAPSAGLLREDGDRSSGARVWRALTGWWAVLILIVAGGGLFCLAQDWLPKNVTNGIDSFGVRADLHLPVPSGGPIHLHGAVIMLAFSALGVLVFHRRTATRFVPVPAAETVISEPKAAEPLSTSVISSAGALISPSVNEVLLGIAEPVVATDPPACRLTIPPPIAVVMPRPAPGIGKMHPCYVTGNLKPAPRQVPDLV